MDRWMDGWMKVPDVKEKQEPMTAAQVQLSCIKDTFATNFFNLGQNLNT